MAQRKLSEESKVIDRHVGMRLRLLRLNHKMSQTELGDKVGVTFQQIQKYERGANRIGASRLWSLCEIFEAEPNFFFDGLSEDEAQGEPNPLAQDTWSEKLLSKQNHRLMMSFDSIDSGDTRAALLRLCEALETSET
ncbi:MAG: helix-turn-helix domain-containing protein [Alphaproteobacteria bacterium]